MHLRPRNAARPSVETLENICNPRLTPELLLRRRLPQCLSIDTEDLPASLSSRLMLELLILGWRMLCLIRERSPWYTE